MDYNPSDSSGTDDDFPPTHQSRGTQGERIGGNGRAVVKGGLTYTRTLGDMETQIHQLEQEAYSSVLRAFKAQSDAITWEKEGLITELRKELRVSDEEHRVLLSRVNADEIIHRIREWRKAGGVQSSILDGARSVHDTVPGSTISASRKKQKIVHSMPSLSVGVPSPALHSQNVAPPMQPSSSTVKRGAPPGAVKGKRPKSGQTLARVSSMKSVQYPSAGPAERCQVANQDSSGAKAGSRDPLIGKRVMTRWPADNSFYEAVITDYNPVDGRHALVYDIHTDDETWEWVNLKEISPDDIRWDGDSGISHQIRGGIGRGSKKSAGQSGPVQPAGRGRVSQKVMPRKDLPFSQNGLGKKGSDDIEILHTESLIKEVERIFGSIHPDPLEMEKAKKLLKDHEQSLIDALARLADASDEESAGFCYSSIWESTNYLSNKYFQTTSCAE